MSGVGGDLTTLQSRTDVMESLGETRDKVARLLTQLENGDHQLPVQEYVLLLGDLLLHSDQVHAAPGGPSATSTGVCAAPGGPAAPQ